MNINKIGEVTQSADGFGIALNDRYREALTGLDGFSHIIVVWWADMSDEEEYRTVTVTEKPYTKGPDTLGIFATRSQFRPNPVAITTVFVAGIDHKTGTVYTPYIDALPGTSVIDIKPYQPCSDRPSGASVPE
ncbi:MAG: TrmO family methyltransferase domain-containing protein [Spirochaetota bacterium]